MSKGITAGSIRWIHEERIDDALTFRAGKQGAQLVADWPGRAMLVCTRDGEVISFEPAAGVSRREVGKLRRGQVRALLRDLAGELTLHASAVAVDGRVVLFLGSDGAGKSTAAAEMCLLHGAEMFGDDAVSVDVHADGARVLPSEDQHWLTSDSCRALGLSSRSRAGTAAKQNLRSLKVGPGPRPLSLIVALRFESSARSSVMDPLRGSAAARLLLDAAIRFDVEDAASRRRELDQLTAIHNRVPIFALTRPRDVPDGVASFVQSAMAQVVR